MKERENKESTVQPNQTTENYGFSDKPKIISVGKSPNSYSKEEQKRDKSNFLEYYYGSFWNSWKKEKV